MDITSFGSHKTGRLLKISAGDGSDWAFIPGPVPRDWSLPHRLSDLLGDAREKLGKLDGIGQTLTDPHLLLTPLQQREAIKSSSLEGTYATPQEMLQYELDLSEPESKTDQRSAWQEVHNYSKALNHGYTRLAVDDFPMTLRLIQETHDKLMRGVRGSDKRPGEFRDQQVHVGSGRRYIPPPANELRAVLDDLEKFLHDETPTLNPLVKAYMAHYQFEAIHPFHDGNGRIGRVLLALCTYRWHGHTKPWLYMSGYFDRYKDEYVDNMFRISTEGDWETWIEFCLRGTVQQCLDSIRRCDRLHALKMTYYADHSDAFDRAHRLIGKLFERPIFRINNVKDWLNVSRPTAKSDIDKLIERGVVRHLMGQKPKTYFAPEIFAAAYQEDSD
ncbi:MAG: Fic/DOC family N-terminal domain-containing protein [Planctomycetota bacterium]